ncbi:hypothetical protein [Pedobacter sp. PLR]|nr:hypothetical protein [Pedobacter sp. PLR]
MKTTDDKYNTAYKRFGRYERENYAFGFVFQSTSRDFILLAPSPSP